MRTLVLTVALLFATSAYAEQRSLSGSEQPAEAVKSEVKASETKTEAKTEAKSEAKSDERKKPAAKKRETDEDKARRIAKRYGVTW